MKTVLNWSAYHEQGQGDAYADIPAQGGDFARAVAVCIRSGVCEQVTAKGVMCPSYRLMPGPDRSPGGRIRLLKQALNRPQQQDWLADPALAQALDSCIGCKGCKRECEAYVDMATIKAEYQAQRVARHGSSLRAWLLAAGPLWLLRFPWLARLLAWRNRSPRLRAWGERLLGLAREAELPLPLTPGFTEGEGWYEPLIAAPLRGELVLWVDPLTGLFRPAEAQAALSLLRRLGYRVYLLPPQDARRRPYESGRADFSIGRIPAAQQHARHLLAALAPHLAAGRPLVGLEPSSLLMLREEYRQLFTTEQQPDGLENAAQQALMLEEFLARELMAHGLELAFKPRTGRLLVHAHCHQKAVGGLKPLRRLLKLIPELDLQFIEAACCGMAGTYGMEAEHIAESRQMAAQALLPALAAAPEADLISGGFGCGWQIRMLTGRSSLGLAQVLLAQLAD
ncbi:4Fe-4S dicluster domain-containing protein [Pseudaeromonas sp. ZJS20]|uniref:(Fe-S)-binding protein n=1 Tax=Pseudaeromonas aegiceratis TaxID=3153928 RepID=UPI00390CAA35